ncbi:uncharacterized protein LOC125654662 [Ostrea edulis]|uniref:uncharacterized protein LOC125654662 n=1 Tax=Ostrea edulis TaxID=37623 RepID=UPI0024AFCF7C|nr:uncharacterized protein LOC125654662 [Ostrea edulis]
MIKTIQIDARYQFEVEKISRESQHVEKKSYTPREICRRKQVVCDTILADKELSPPGKITSIRGDRGNEGGESPSTLDRWRHVSYGEIEFESAFAITTLGMDNIDIHDCESHKHKDWNHVLCC